MYACGSAVLIKTTLPIQSVGPILAWCYFTATKNVLTRSSSPWRRRDNPLLSQLAVILKYPTRRDCIYHSLLAVIRSSSCGLCLLLCRDVRRMRFVCVCVCVRMCWKQHYRGCVSLGSCCLPSNVLDVQYFHIGNIWWHRLKAKPNIEDVFKR